MKDYKEELIKYCDDTLATKHVKKRTKMDWIFGAVLFAFTTGLISQEEKEEINTRYDIW